MSDLVNIPINTTHPDHYVLLNTHDGTQWEISEWGPGEFRWKDLGNTPLEIDAAHAQVRLLANQLDLAGNEVNRLRDTLHAVITCVEDSEATDVMTLRADVLATIAQYMIPQPS